MKTLLSTLLFLSASFIFFSCDDGPTIVPCDKGVFATVRDLTGLDGCGFVFELADGTRLEPIRQFLRCGTPPLPKEVTEDPLFNFQFVEGKKVSIGFEEMTEGVSICMVGKVIKINCISEVSIEE
jgi:hypothetical protein